MCRKWKEKIATHTKKEREKELGMLLSLIFVAVVVVPLSFMPTFLESQNFTQNLNK